MAWDSLQETRFGLVMTKIVNRDMDLYGVA